MRKRETACTCKLREGQTHNWAQRLTPSSIAGPWDPEIMMWAEIKSLMLNWLSHSDALWLTYLTWNNFLLFFPHPSHSKLLSRVQEYWTLMTYIMHYLRLQMKAHFQLIKIFLGWLPMRWQVPWSRQYSASWETFAASHLFNLFSLSVSWPLYS